MQEIVKIDSPIVKRIKIIDKNELLVDLLGKYPELYVDKTRKYVQKLSKSISLVRKTVAEKLMLAQGDLPNGLKFMIIEGYRPVEVQRKIFNNYMNSLKDRYPNLSKKKLYQKAVLFVAPPDNVPPHSTGGAVDLTLVGGKQREELDMGTKLNEAYNKDCYTLSNNISNESAANRRILIEVLTKQGFVNYPSEWWHWSYGDQYWAFIKKKSLAFYSSVR